MSLDSVMCPICLYGPLSGRVYQRHGAQEWALVEQSEGFA